jgi:cytochrome bd ubiquinol oxidase subunit II
VTLAEVPLVLMLVGLIAYAVLGGADFGAAFWQLSARNGARSEARREHAYQAMGPVWEANHVWLIFVLVICWTAYPEAFASIFSTLTVPLFIAAVGIILRGTAYAVHAGTAREIERQAIDAVFSVSSILTPFALGTAIGGIASGRVPVGNAEGDLLTSWVNPTSFAIGTIAVATGAYLAAVYLAGDAARAGLDDLTAAFRTRALAAGAVTGAVALAGLLVVSLDAEKLRDGLFGWPAILALVASAATGLATLELVRRACFEPARYLASAAVAAIVVGWALAQRSELLPGLTVEDAAAERPALIATIVGVAFGAVVLVPSLALLFGLVLRGRFDREAAETQADTRARTVALHGRPIAVLAMLALTVGLPSTFLADGGPVQAVGVVALLAFVTFGSAALGSAAAAVATHDEGG